MSNVDRLSISLPAELGAQVRASAAAASQSVSAWLAEAAAQSVRNRNLSTALDEWEKEHGAPTEAELAAAARRLGFDEEPNAATDAA